MQAPPVQYVMTSDGVRIAYTVSGDGPPLLFLTEPLVSHVQLEWSHPLFGRLYRRLAERNTLLRLDGRGVGLSQRNVDRFDPGSFERDIEAVIARVGWQRFSLVGVQVGAVGTLMYAARNLERIERLVLVDGFARMRDIAATPTSQALGAAARADFFLATEAIGAAALGAGRDEVRDYGAYIRACIDPDYFAGRPGDLNGDVFDLWDATALLPALSMPALVIRHTSLNYVTAEMSMDLAARLPNATYREVTGGWADDPEGVIDIVNDFVAGERSMSAGSERASHSPGDASVRTILFTDIEGHTPMMQRLGDAAGRDLLREHERITRAVIASHGGSEIKTIGDAFMVSFGSVASAAQCAVDLQRAFETTATVEPLRIRIGLNAGEPIAEDGDLFGSSVILASRIVAQAQGGEILVSDVVRSLLSGKNFLFHDRGEIALRGFEDPVRLYELHWRAEP